MRIRPVCKSFEVGGQGRHLGQVKGLEGRDLDSVWESSGSDGG